MLHFAWDNPADMGTLEKLKEYRSVWKGSQRNRSVYVLTNFNSTHEEDLYRVYTLRDIGYDPYIMILINLMRWIKQGTCSVGLTINRYLGRLRSSKTMITREGEIMANLKITLQWLIR